MHRTYQAGNAGSDGGEFVRCVGAMDGLVGADVVTPLFVEACGDVGLDLMGKKGD